MIDVNSPRSVFPTRNIPHIRISITMVAATRRGNRNFSRTVTTGVSVYEMKIANTTGIKNFCAHCNEKTNASVAIIASAVPRASTWILTGMPLAVAARSAMIKWLGTPSGVSGGMMVSIATSGVSESNVAMPYPKILF